MEPISYQSIIDLRIKTGPQNKFLDEKLISYKNPTLAHDLYEQANPILKVLMFGNENYNYDRDVFLSQSLGREDIQSELYACSLFRQEYISDGGDYQSYCALYEEERFKLYCRRYASLKAPVGDVVL